MLLFFLFAFSNAALVDRQCGSNLQNLWLDVVAVIDNSDAMTQSSMQSVIATVATVFEYGTVIGTDPNNPKTTRVGIVTYNSQATVKADLDKYRSIDDFADNVANDIGIVSSSGESYLATGLEAAEELLFSNEEDPRGHYRKVIIVFAADFGGTGQLNPVPIAERIQTSGVTIITVSYTQDPYVLEGLQKVASPHNNFTSGGQDLISNIQNSLLQSNCFCRSYWRQYRLSYPDYWTPKFGVCLQPFSQPATWKTAQLFCRNQTKNGYLANEYTQNKHDFIFNMTQNAGFPQPFNYHIGLFFNANKWVWDQPEGWTQPNVSDFMYWSPGYPTSSGSNSGGVNYQMGGGVAWRNIPLYTYPAYFVCEVASCDTDNYCEITDFF
uniref:VWFA domain-containing protein n=1 Tax=Caenorhabditis tropicalis TaxID=1561998 RepID=A0A1I7UTF6_9PELO